ncbi:MAG: hypothetical protein MR739_00430 [Spirochaetia bacterium]|nr:hypothetical protein [Spirochaetia bacterium]
MKFLFKILLFFSVFLFFSCSAEIVFEVKKDGNVKISYDGDLSGDFLQFLINQNDKNAELDLENIENTELDVEVLIESLKNSGFENVQILSGKLKNILITMEDKSQKSVLFHSKLLKMQNGSLSVDFSYENLRNFYENADEQLQSDLDLLLAPVFNDEKMTETEYLETIATFYGEKMASELAESFISLIVINIDGKQQVQKISIPKILCGM